MMRAAGCALIFLWGTMIGWSRREKMVQKLKEWEEFQHFLQFIQEELSLTLCSSEELLRKASEVCSFSMIEYCLQQPGGSLQTRWKEAAQKIDDEKLRTRILQFGERFGTASCEAQQENIRFLMHEVQGEIQEQKQVLSQEGRLSCSLGMLCGAGLAILFL